MKLPKNFSHGNIETGYNGNISFTVQLDKTSDWTNYLHSFKTLNSIELVYKQQKRPENSFSELLGTFICHHGNRYGNDADNRALINSTRSKKNNCQFQLKLHIKKILPKILDVACINAHNHEVGAAHSNSFLKIPLEMIQEIEGYFQNKMSVRAVKYELEKNLSFKDKCNRSINPNAPDLYRIYYKWMNKCFGAQNGPEMFEKLKQRASKIDGNYYYSGNCFN